VLPHCRVLRSYRRRQRLHAFSSILETGCAVGQEIARLTFAVVRKVHTTGYKGIHAVPAQSDVDMG